MVFKERGPADKLIVSMNTVEEQDQDHLIDKWFVVVQLVVQLENLSAGGENVGAIVDMLQMHV